MRVSHLFPALGEEFFDQPSTSCVLGEGHTARHYHLPVNQNQKDSYYQGTQVNTYPSSNVE